MHNQIIIGGEFQISPNVLQCDIRNVFNPTYSLGRTCLYGIFDALRRKNGGVLVPDYVCNSVTEVPIRLGLSIKHYHINETFTPDYESIRNAIHENKEIVAILLVAYFGLVDLDTVITRIRAEFPDIFIIIDDVQNYYGFGEHFDYDYCFTSYRKWFAVPDGADILRKGTMPGTELYPHEGDYVRYKAAGNLLKNHNELVNDSISLELIDRGERMMDEEYRFRCSDLSKSLMQRIDTELIAERRKANAQFLHDGLVRLNIQHLYDSKRVPLFIPIVVENRDKIRKRLFADEIFAPIHWPVIDSVTQGNNKLYEMELSIICDQRYGEKDMERILHGIEDAM